MTTRWFSLAAASASLILVLAQKTSAVSATGGTVTTNGGYRIHTFTNSGSATFTVASGGNVDVLVVAGGGGGGNCIGGGGGAGGLIYTSSYAIITGSILVTVGAGGAGGIAGFDNGGFNGSNSTFGGLLAYGGGGGAGWSAILAKNGGSGGGGQAGKSGALGTNGQGKAGGTGGPVGTKFPAGGGGGAGSAGGNGVEPISGNGGTGLQYSISGVATYYAGGGGGGSYLSGPSGTGGAGGGGNGGIAGGNNPGFPGTNGTGGGGGAGAYISAYTAGGSGGAGIVIVRYLGQQPFIENRPATNMTTSSAWMNGYLSSTGQAPVTVSVYWGNTDCGTTSGLWQATNTLAGSGWTNGAFLTSQATGLTANAYYYYRYYATNSFGEGWASSSERFLAGNITVTNTDSDAMESAPGWAATNLGILTIERAPAATNEALTVYYAWEGTAVNGVDYIPSPPGTSVTLSAGVASTNITITPLWSGVWSTKTAWLTLQPGAYGIGSPASNVVTITNYPVTPGANVTTNAGNWHSGAIWSLGRRPVPGDAVTVRHAVLVTNTTDYLSSFIITNATLTFSNWVTVLQAASVTIGNGGSLGLPTAFTNNAMSNRIYVVCSNLTLEVGGQINASGKGYAGGVYSTTHTAGYGPGGGEGVTAGGGGYGGTGGKYPIYGVTYGDSNAPVDPGSGGGAWGTYDTAGGDGGGAVRLEVSGSATLAGTISANGANWRGSYGGGGAGGSIYIQADTLMPAQGTLSAQGGYGSSSSVGGGGGGGRIALTGWTHDGFSGTITVAPGGPGSYPGQTGTVVRQSFPGGCLLTVQADPQRHGVSSPYDYGSHVFSNGTPVTNSITLTAEETNGFRYICRQWTLTNAAGMVTGGSPTQAVFTITNNLFLTWLWTNQYYLSTTAATNGTLTADKTGWYTNGTTLQVTAVPDGGHEFLLWSGTGVPVGHSWDNPMELTMDRARNFQAVFADSGSAVTRTWTGTNNWVTATNWSPTGIPVPGDSVIIQSGNCLLSDPMRVVNVVVSNAATLTFSNWPTALQASNVTIRGGGRLTHAACTTNLATNRISIICSTILIESNGAINVDGMGYPGGNGGPGYGPGGGPLASGSGGGYGGVGGAGGGTGGATYGSEAAPTDPGSGAAGWTGPAGIGGAGGGAVRIDASGLALINGTISANGVSGSSSYWGGGAGGSIFLTCGTFAGTNGIIRASGVNGTASTSYSGGGGGGRIAIICTNSAEQTLLPIPSVGFATDRGAANNSGDIGSVYLSHVSFLPSYLTFRYAGRMLGFTTWTHDSLTITNTWIGAQGINLTVTNDLKIVGSSGRLDARNAPVTVGGSILLSSAALYMYADGTNCPTLSCGTNLTLTNSAVFHVYSGMTNAATTNYGARVAIAGDLNVWSNCAVYPHSTPTNGGSPFFTMANLSVASNAQINANGLGFAGGLGTIAPYTGYGPGRGGSTGRGGGGYGGTGALSTVGYGRTYGSSNAPIDAGSGGACEGNSSGGYGGGVVRMEITGAAKIAGTIAANGGSWNGSYGGGGAGGSIFLRARNFAPAQGTLSAYGGAGCTTGWEAGGGGGGGGRIALISVRNFFTGVTNVAGGIGGTTGQNVGGIGTVYVLLLPPPGTIFTIR